MQNTKKDQLKSNPETNAKKPLPFGCVVDSQPQQQEFVFDEVTLDSCFDSGNMAYAEKESDNHVRMNFKLVPEHHSIIFGSLLIVRRLLLRPTSKHGFTSGLKMSRQVANITTLSLLKIQIHK